jgi:hypothetical protein
MRSREERMVENELLFRDVNERIAEFDAQRDKDLEVLCECADDHCTKAIRIQTEQYGRVREYADRFIVLPGHQVAAVEDVVEAPGSYLIVEKHLELLNAVDAPHHT